MSNIDHPMSIDRDYIRLLQAMRRFIRDEFDCDIRMTQDDALGQLLHFAERSRNSVLQEMSKELREFVQKVPAGDESGKTDGQTIRYYRGAAIVVSEDQHGTAPVPHTVREENPKRIYRGQVISG